MPENKPPTTTFSKSKSKDIDIILAKVLKEISPDHKVLEEIEQTVASINNMLRKNKIAAVCVTGGSIGKDTFLKDDYDVDLFVRFSLEYKKENLSNILESILKKIHKNIARIHGSRDYFQFTLKNIDYEIIPVLKIQSSNYQEAENVTDLSPEHVYWVKKYTEKNPELKDSIRLAKQFCKANNVYGAESYINGFSGHILDILIIHYGSFINLIKKFSEIKDVSDKCPIIFNPENRMKNPLKELNKSKISPIIIVDPVQPDRNAAAALSQEKLLIFIDSCRRFLKNPSENFFIIEKFDLKKEIEKSINILKDDPQYRKILLKTFIIEVKTVDGSKDIVGTKVLKFYEDVLKHLSLNGFNAVKSDWNFRFLDRYAVIYLLVADESLSDMVEHPGPPVKAKLHYEKFLNEHSKNKTFIRNSHIYAMVKRKYIDVESCLKAILNEDFITRRVASIKMRMKP